MRLDKNVKEQNKKQNGAQNSKRPRIEKYKNIMDQTSIKPSCPDTTRQEQKRIGK